MAQQLAGWMSTTEAATYAGVSRQRIDQLARTGVLDSEMIGGRRLVHCYSLDAWIRGRPYRQAWRPRNLQHLRLKRAEILDLARRHHLANVRVFGSVARGEAGPDSDVDVLIDREPGATVLDIAEFATDLEDSLGCRVDVVVDSGDGSAIQAIRSSAAPL